MKTAVHFGAGNIGRGFIGLLLNKAGFHVTFSDVSDVLIDALKERKQYTVELISDAAETIVVEGVDGLNSKFEQDRLTDLLATADLITTAVGPNILPFIAKNIAPAIEKRVLNNSIQFTNIIACENTIEGSTKLKNALVPLLSPEALVHLEQFIGFPDSAVDRIVPNQKNEDVLWVKVEPFYEWVVDSSKIKGELEIPGVHFTPSLEAYIERKLFTVNTGHASTAYSGYLKGYTTVYEAIQDPEVEALVRGVLAETSSLLVVKHGFDAQTQAGYVDKTIKRFKNPSVVDEVVRVGRGPLRKLSANDRFFKPMLELYNRDMDSTHLQKVVALALQFNVSEDEESVKLQALILDKGKQAALAEVSGLAQDHPLIQSILKL